MWMCKNIYAEILKYEDRGQMGVEALSQSVDVQQYICRNPKICKQGRRRVEALPQNTPVQQHLC